VYEQLAKADALVYATPLYWYGMSATLKNFFDRMICYMSASNPRSTEVVEKLRGKRVALLISSEERYPASPMSLILQIQEISRYMYQPFVGVVQGFGNKRGEVQYDPLDPVGAAAKLGAGHLRSLPQRLPSRYRQDSRLTGLPATGQMMSRSTSRSRSTVPRSSPSRRTSTRHPQACCCTAS